MPIFQAIAAMSENRVIGHQGKIPWHLPEDYRWFKRKTMGGTLIMGRKTFEGIGEILPGRKTVVISRNSEIAGVTNCHAIPSLEAMISSLPEPYWICGGAEIYQLFLEKCAVLYLTQVKRTVEGDAFFPPFESTFVIDQTIHENSQFRVERWVNSTLRDRSGLPPESWPFEESRG